MTENDRSVRSDLEDIVRREVRASIDWYQRKKARQRRYYRIVAVLTIVVASAIPFVNSLGYEAAHLVASSMALAISILTAFSTTFRWDQVWRSFTNAQAELEYMLSRWELHLIGMELSTDEERKEAKAQTLALLDAARRVREGEANEYFQAVSIGNDERAGSPERS